jgi:predicted Zn-dependent protease
LTAFTGSFTDGKTAARRDVTVLIGTDVLTIKFENGVVENWLLKSVAAVEEAYPGQPVRLRYETAPDARLTVEGPEFLSVLIRTRPDLARSASRSRSLLRGSAIGLACAVVTIVLVGVVVPWISTVSAVFVPIAWETEVGEKVVDQIAALTAPTAVKFCQDVDGTAALDRLIARLSKGIEINYPLRVRVVASPMVNAFAAPGGNIAIMAGLIKKAETSAEVAGVIAHEMGHVVERHPTEGMIKNIGLSIILEAISGGFFGSETLSGMAGTLVALSYSREAEAEADQVAINILTEAGISRQGLAHFFERMRSDEKKGITVPQFLSSHPVSTEREAKVRSAEDRGGEAMTEKDWRALKGICDG